MFKIKILRNIFLASLLIATVLPLYDILVVHPTYIQVMKSQAEDEATRYAEYLVKSFELRRGIMKDALPDSFVTQVVLVRNTSLVKLRLFDASGEIVFSTEKSEIGTINTKAYFREVVAAGKIYSKQVKKEGFTADQEATHVDIVEIYIPIMDGNRFQGAFEIYLDVTKNSDRLDSLTVKSTTLLFVISLSLFSVILLMLVRMRTSIELQVNTERQLRELNNQLEERVLERTKDLESSNRKLSTQMTERVRIEQDLLDAYSDSNSEKKKAQSILESVVDGLLVVDRDLRVGMINGAAIKLLNVNQEDIVGETLTHLLPDKILVAQLKESLVSLREDFSQFDYNVSDGSGRIYRIRLFRVSTTKGEEKHSIIHIEDVTGDRLVDKMKKEFLAMAAHELRTPLATILGYSELLQEPSEQFTPKERHEFAGFIAEKAELLSRIVDDLLDISRVEGGQELTLNCSNFDYRALVNRIFNRYCEQYREIDFQMVSNAEEIFIYADSMRLTQVVENIISNAIKYSSREKVTIRCNVVAGLCETIIEDKGAGMTADEVEQVFEKFYRVHPEDNSVSGTGLGLSIAKHIIEAHGGHIWLRSTVGEGTRVGFTLPVDQKISEDIGAF